MLHSVAVYVTPSIIRGSPRYPELVASRTDDQFLEAGRRTLRRYGYEGATVERIAEEAGVSRVTLHRRGVSRKSLLAAFAARVTAQYQSAMWPVITGPEDGRSRLHAALAALCDLAEENLDLLIALRAQSDRIFHEEAEEALTRSVFTAPFERVLRDGATDGSLRAVDPLEYATVLFNLVGWTYVHLRTGHGWPPERARHATFDVALNGLTQNSRDVVPP